MLDTVQQITLKFIRNSKKFLITTIYARCNALKRLELCKELKYIAENNHQPWMTREDFNIIFNEEEKLGGFTFYSI